MEKIKHEINKKIFEFHVQKWLKDAKIRCKKSTYSNYQYTVNAYIINRFGKLKTKHITKELINNFTTELINKGLSPKTIKDILIILQQILKSASIDINITAPKVPKKEIKILEKEEQKLLEQILIKNFNYKSFGIYLCLYTGLRIGEICALKWNDIDLINKKIYINKTITRIKNEDKNNLNKTTIIIDNPKSSSSIRVIPISDFILPLIKKLSEEKELSDFILTGNKKPIETRSYFNYYKKIASSIGLEKYNFHTLRHTFATRCIEKGFDPKTLSEILGHSDVKITLEKYVHPNYANKVRMMNQLELMYTM